MTDTWRAITRYERVDFYSQWRAASDRNEMATSNTPVSVGMIR